MRQVCSSIDMDLTLCYVLQCPWAEEKTWSIKSTIIKSEKNNPSLCIFLFYLHMSIPLWSVKIIEKDPEKSKMWSNKNTSINIITLYFLKATWSHFNNKMLVTIYWGCYKKCFIHSYSIYTYTVDYLLLQLLKLLQKTIQPRTTILNIVKPAFVFSNFWAVNFIDKLACSPLETDHASVCLKDKFPFLWFQLEDIFAI